MRVFDVFGVDSSAALGWNGLMLILVFVIHVSTNHYIE